MRNKTPPTTRLELLDKFKKNIDLDGIREFADDSDVILYCITDDHVSPGYLGYTDLLLFADHNIEVGTIDMRMTDLGIRPESIRNKKVIIFTDSPDPKYEALLGKHFLDLKNGGYIKIEDVKYINGRQCQQGPINIRTIYPKVEAEKTGLPKKGQLVFNFEEKSNSDHV